MDRAGRNRERSGSGWGREGKEGFDDGGHLHKEGLQIVIHNL